MSLYIFFTFANTMVSILVIQNGSAALAVLTSACCRFCRCCPFTLCALRPRTGAMVIPAGNICFALPAIAGEHARPLAVTDVVALIVIVAGSFVPSAVAHSCSLFLSLLQLLQVWCCTRRRRTSSACRTSTRISCRCRRTKTSTALSATPMELCASPDSCPPLASAPPSAFELQTEMHARSLCSRKHLARALKLSF